MTKKQRNRKLVAQNKRNRLYNRRYSSTIRTLLKSFFFRRKNLVNSEEKNSVIQEMKTLNQNLSSLFDKAVNKNVIHKNKAARKKSKLVKVLKNLSSSI